MGLMVLQDTYILKKGPKCGEDEESELIIGKEIKRGVDDAGEKEEGENTDAREKVLREWMHIGKGAYEWGSRGRECRWEDCYAK